MHEQTSIETRDGAARVHVFTPSQGSGPWPAAIFYMDGLGIRSTLFAMAQRLADAGHLVLLPDMFWRAGEYAPLDPKVIFAGGNIREQLAHLFSAMDNQRAMTDTSAYLDWLAADPRVAGTNVGVTGYCMGGAIALMAAGTYPDRIVAAASFHGGSLATDDPLSPHLLAPAMRARVYVAGADSDASYPPEMEERLDAALTAAKVDHVCEIYPGALHGWTMADFPIYNEAAAERHWVKLLELFAATLH